MDAAGIARTIRDRLADLADLHRQDDPQPGQLGAVVLEGIHVFVTTSDARVYRVTVEPWP